jgi:hypothetical protein
MVRDCRHTAAYLFGAACPQRAVGAAIVMPSVNSEAMSEHLAEIARTSAATLRAGTQPNRECLAVLARQ